MITSCVHVRNLHLGANLHPGANLLHRICTNYIKHRLHDQNTPQVQIYFTKVKVAKFSFLNEKSFNKTVIDFNFGRHKDLSTLKNDIHLGLAVSVNYHFFRVDKPLCLPH